LLVDYTSAVSLLQQASPISAEIHFRDRRNATKHG
jgi:hypothetical protein